MLKALSLLVLVADIPEVMGFEPRDRGALDTAKYWTMVSNAAFTKDGDIRQIELYSGAAGRRLRIGI